MLKSVCYQYALSDLSIDLFIVQTKGEEIGKMFFYYPASPIFVFAGKKLVSLELTVYQRKHAVLILSHFFLIFLFKRS